MCTITKPFILSTRVCDYYRQPSQALSQRMSSLGSHTDSVNISNNEFGAVEKGLKLVYTPTNSKKITITGSSELGEEFGDRLVVETGSDEQTLEVVDGCTSTTFKPRRPFCDTCRKAQSLCICVRIKTIVDNEVGITILQHPEEKDHHLGSARIAALSLRKVEVLSIPEADARRSFRIRHKIPGSKRSIAGRVGKKGKLKPGLRQLVETTVVAADRTGDAEEDSFDPYAIPSWMNLPPGAGLLFPSEKAIDLIPESCKRNKQMDRPTHLIVLDGTWSKAKRIYFENLWLQRLPHYNLPLSLPSMYGNVRKEPKAGCLSTVESIVFALRMLEPDTVGLDSLLEVFDSMIADAKGFQEQTEIKYLNRNQGVL